ncbi:MAG TPA: MlaD family protein [Thermoleophilaceae bacterium]|nr:MlaD family protein [Thermoleophilaceae bacterium]
MQKAAPSVGRILTMVVFALSCFGLLLFLWVSFGGAIPLQPQGYRFDASFPEAVTLAEQADVRIAGVNVGKVESKELDKGAASTTATLEIEDKFAPIPEDTRAILRQKTLLGETYVELTPGNPDSGMLPEGGTLAAVNVEQQTELDEILRIFQPETRRAFRRWVSEQATSIEGGTDQDLNDALGNLPEFAESGNDVLTVLDRNGRALEQLIRNTGVVFGALNEQEGALRGLIVNSNRTFEAVASEQEALTETIQVFPTFLRESRLTLDRLETFSRDTNPLINDLKPVADDLGPTVRRLASLSPELRSFFRDLPPLVRSGTRTLPDAQRFLRGSRPVFEGLHRFLPELNPILSFANFYRGGLADFISVGGAALNIGLPPDSGEPTRVHVLPQFALLGSNSPHFERTEQRNELRANAYNKPGNLGDALVEGVIPSMSCAQFGGVIRRPLNEDEGDEVTAPPCVEAGNYGWDGNRYPQVRGSIPPLEGGGRIPMPTPFPQPGQGLAPRGDNRGG